MAGEDQEQNAEAHIAMSPLPDFFANTPATWFQQAEARFAVASQLQQTSFHNAPSPRPETMATGTRK
jgi:hypothetical protein